MALVVIQVMVVRHPRLLGVEMIVGINMGVIIKVTRNVLDLLLV
jgi:hypothetical protein